MSSGSRASRLKGCGCLTRGCQPIAAEARPLRIAILGAGSIGCFVGGCWQLAGLDVRYFGRPAFAEAVAAHGLRLSDHGGWEAAIAPAAIDFRCEPERLAEADVIALCVKSGATEEAARQILAHGQDGALVISLQNGVSNVQRLGDQLGSRFAVARGMVPFNIAYLGNGHFHKGVAGDLFVEPRDETRRLAKAVGPSPAALQLSGDMIGLAWGKLLINLNNAVNALSGRSLAEELRQQDYRRVFAASMREGLALLGKAGIRPARVGAVGPHILPWIIGSPDWLFNSLFMRAWKIDSKARSSMADDLAAGRPTEIAFINGELVSLADRLGLKAPVNRRIVALVRRAEAGAAPLAPADLRRAVLGG